jgi:hypothetical protein
VYWLRAQHFSSLRLEDREFALHQCVAIFGER